MLNIRVTALKLLLILYIENLKILFSKRKRNIFSKEELTNWDGKVFFSYDIICVKY